MYLAEDRILSLGIYCQPHSDFCLKYIPNAKAKTDPMKTHYDVIHHFIIVFGIGIILEFLK